MRNQKLKILSFFLAFVFVIILFPSKQANAAAAAGSCGTNATWVYVDGTLTISGSGKMDDYTSGYKTTPWKDYRTSITKVVVSGVTNIGVNSFASCTNLTSVSIGSSVTTIGDKAFNKCTSLTSLSVPNSVTSLGSRVFMGCSALKTITLSSKLTSIPSYCFSSCGSLTSVTIPSGVTLIDLNAFESCTSLKTVSIPNTVKTIKDYAFKYCSSLTSVTIPSSVTSLGSKYGYVFQGCGLTSVTIPSSITTIFGYTFLDCTKLTKVTLPDNLVKIDEDAFNGCTSLTTINLNDNITEIADYAFYNCKALTSFYMPKNIVYFGEHTLEGSGVKTVTFKGTADMWNGIIVLPTEDEVDMNQVMKDLGITVDIAYTPTFRIITEPANVYVKVGQTATFYVEAEGEGLTYQWQWCQGPTWYDCTEASAKTATLTFKTNIDQSGYQYHCVITNNKGATLTTRPVVLALDAPDLYFKVQPVDCTAAAGGKATFSVLAVGEGLTYQWQCNASGTWQNSKLAGFDTPTLNFDAFTSRNGYRFRCVVTDCAGNSITSDEVTLHVTQPITIKTQPKDYTGVAGSKATFTVVAEGDSLSYQWQAYSNGQWKPSSLPGAKTATLSVDAFSSRNGYQFRCYIKNAKGDAVITNVATLHVTATALSIKAQPTDVTTAAGTTAKFSVLASGDGLTYQWQAYSNGSWKASSLPGAKTATLSVDAFTSRDGLKFRCVVKNAGGSTVTSDAATLHVTMPVSIKTQPKDYTATVGSKATFTVVAEGTGLTYQWYAYANGAWKASSLTGAKTATLTVDAFTSRNGYKFRCVVKNANGISVTSNEVTLHVVSTAITISSQPQNCTATVGSTAIFSVRAEGEGLTYQWQAYTGGEWKNSSLPGAKTATLSVDAFTSRNGYQFRCVIKSTNGTSVISDSAYLKVVTAATSVATTSDAMLAGEPVITEPVETEETVEVTVSEPEAVEETVSTEVVEDIEVTEQVETVTEITEAA